MPSRTHGLTGSPEYRTWTDIKTRCYNRNAVSWPFYGGRGIKVCDRWLRSFSAFLEDMGKKPSRSHSIDRIDNDGDYEPRNCRWASRLEQAQNKSNTRVLTICGRSMPLSEWAREIGISSGALIYRIKAGKRGERLLLPNQKSGCVSFNGISDTYAGWSRRTGIKESTIAMRLTKYNWTVERALTEGAKRCAFSK